MAAFDVKVVTRRGSAVTGASSPKGGEWGHASVIAGRLLAGIYRMPRKTVKDLAEALEWACMDHGHDPNEWALRDSNTRIERDEPHDVYVIDFTVGAGNTGSRATGGREA